MPISPHSPRRQRRAVYNADTFERRLRMTVPLSRELRKRFHRRSVPLRKGDTVRVMKGSFIGREERVAKIDRRGYSVTLDNVTLKTGEEKLKPLPVRTNHLLIVRLNLADAWRREALKVREEEVTPEELGVTPESSEGDAPAPTVAAPAAPPSKPRVPDEADDDEDDPPSPAPAAKRPRKAKGAAPPETPEEDDA
jgi:large subunit ribosomal protein L24